MSKFQYTANGLMGDGHVIWEVTHVESGKVLGLVAKGSRHGWVAWVRGEEETGYLSRKTASERLLLVSGVDPVAWAALPTDPFDGVSA